MGGGRDCAANIIMRRIIAKPIVDDRQFLKINKRTLFRFVEENGRKLIEVQQLSGKKADELGKFSYITPEDLMAVLREYVGPAA